MFPLRDSKSAKAFPLVTILIIALNLLVFFQELGVKGLGEKAFNAFIREWALVPALIDWSNTSTLIPLLTSQFFHAGWLHILANMWFLWIFGDNVEEHFGKLSFPIVYLLSGIAGGLFQYIINPSSTIPMLGASGAVAGVLGAYMVFFPKHKIETLVLTFGFLTVIKIPAGFMLIYWFLIQLFSGVGSLAVAAAGGVAWFAHIGGFLTGWLVAKLSKQSLFLAKSK